MGFPLSEIVFPGITLTLIGLFGWRTTYLLFAVILVILMIPIQFFLLSRSELKHNTFYPEELWFKLSNCLDSMHVNLRINTPTTHSKKPLETLSFSYFLIASTIPPIVMTGLFFHQSTLFNSHQWPIVLAASGSSIYAITKAVAALLIGPVIDRYGSGYAFASVIILIGLGTFLAGVGGSSLIIYTYLGILGAALGMSAPIMNHLWASLYGSKHIGSIKGFIGTFRNGLTGFGPLPIALALDNGIQITTVLIYTSIAITGVSIIPIVITLIDQRLKNHS